VAYVFGQITVANNSTAPIFTIPPGLCNITFWNVSTGTVYVGTSTAVTTANGMQCHSIPTSFFSYVSSKGTPLYGANTSGTSAVVQYVISNDQ
jgi:hypothetical protein